MSTCLIVTGASGELGRAVLAAAIERPDVNTIIATTRRNSSASDCEKVRALHDVDLSQEVGVRRLTAAVEKIEANHLALLHCIGTFPVAAPLHKHALDDVGSIMAANVTTFIGAVKALLPSMRKVRSGRVVAFTSHTQDAAYPFLGPFNMSKAALRSAVQTLSHENARFGIAANAIAVATLQTAVERQIKPAGSYEDWVPVEGLAAFAIDLCTAFPPHVNGTELQFWTYSPSFFGESVLTRNSLEIAEMDPADD